MAQTEDESPPSSFWSYQDWGVNVKFELPAWVNTVLLVLIVFLLLFRFSSIPQTTPVFPAELKVYGSNMQSQGDPYSLTDGNHLWVVDQTRNEVRVFELRDGQITVAKHRYGF